MAKLTTNNTRANVGSTVQVFNNKMEVFCNASENASNMVSHKAAQCHIGETNNPIITT